MRIYRHFHQADGRPLALAIGNFDGMHLGHQAMMAKLAEVAQTRGLKPAVMTFEPHPREYFSPADAPARLASLREKLLLLDAAGVDRTYVCRFDARLAAQPAQTFIDDTLVRGLAVRHLFIGDDFRFGTRRQGDFAMLQAAGAQHGFAVESMPTLAAAGERVSSSAVRDALAADDLDHAARLLGRPYSIAGRVSHGDKLGRQLGFPTANIQMKHRRPALTGVYAVSVEGLAATRVQGVANIGVRPTATANGRARLEVHLFDWTQDCYGAHIRVHFLHRLRAERKFESLDALRAQIAIDTVHARDWFAQHPAPL